MSNLSTAGSKNWLKVVSQYREPSKLRSVWVVANTIIPFFILWTFAWYALNISYYLSFTIAIVLGFFLMRVFCLQHDCGHNALFQSRRVNDWLGRFFSILTITPYALWRKMHNYHHASNGNLDARELGDVKTLTVIEYLERNTVGRLAYRIYRNPIFLFGFAPFLLFFVQQRLPFGYWRDARCWISAMSLNFVLLAILLVMYKAGGWSPILLIMVPSILIGATAGIFTFYVQHQFEAAHWERTDDWNVLDAAVLGSTHIVLPKWLAWFTANITIHHVHHLYARVPFYRLPEIIRDYPELGSINKISFRDSLRSINFHLWDERAHQMTSFSKVKSHRDWAVGGGKTGR